MNYKLICPTCNKEVIISTRGAVKYIDCEGRIEYSCDCPKCEEEIELIRLYREKR